jgi:hypothetical protein
MLKLHMARLAYRQQIFQRICFYRIGKQAIGFDMVNSQVLSFLLPRFPTDLTSMIIAFAGCLALCFPRWTTSQLSIGIRAVNIPIMFCRVVLIIVLQLFTNPLPLCLSYFVSKGGRSPFLYLQFCETTSRTCLTIMSMTAFFVERLSAIDARQFNSLCLTCLRAVACSGASCKVYFKRLTTRFTYPLNTGYFTLTIAGFRAKTSIFPGKENFEGLSAIFTYLCDTAHLVLCIARSRTEAARFFLRQINSKWFPALLACLCDIRHHAFGVAFVRTETPILSSGEGFKGFPARFAGLDNGLFSHISSIP